LVRHNCDGLLRGMASDRPPARTGLMRTSRTLANSLKPDQEQRIPPEIPPHARLAAESRPLKRGCQKRPAGPVGAELHKRSAEAIGFGRHARLGRTGHGETTTWCGLSVIVLHSLTASLRRAEPALWKPCGACFQGVGYRTPIERTDRKDGTFEVNRRALTFDV
jgi:hypothetical protein